MKKHTNNSKELLKLMKIGGFQVVFILLTMNCLSAFTGAAQSILDHEVILGANGQSLENVLAEIEKRTDAQFTYSVQKIDINQVIHYPTRTTNLAQLLADILSPLSIQYTVFNNRNIVLSRQVKEKIKSGIILTGTVYSQLGEPVQFANVILRKPNDEPDFILGTITDEFGKFNLDDLSKGSYELSVSFIGYESIDTVLSISKSIDLGTLIMAEQVNTLSDVSVTGRRKLIRQEIDRLILDIENSLLASKGNALDVLASTPGVSVLNDNINMIGKSTVGILVDNKLIDLPPDEVANFLRSISSEDIKHIEVITTPPAKYEAEGNSGLIHIMLKKAKKDSWNASIRSGYAKKTESSANLGASFTYNKNKLSLASSLFYIKGLYYQEQDDYAYFPDGLWYTLSPLLSDYERFNGRIDVNYQVTPSWSIGAQYMRNSTDYLITDNPYTQVSDYQTKEVKRYLLSTFSQMTWKPLFNSTNLNSSVNLDTTGKKMHINLDYFKYDNEDIRQYEGESVVYNPDVFQYYNGRNNNFQEIDNISAGIDFDFPTPLAEFSFGAKMTRSISTNDISLFNSGLVDEPVQNMPLANNDFKYEENLQALYLSVTRPISSKLQAKLGARLESTKTKSLSDNLNLDESNNYLKLFPTLYLTYKASDRVSYSFTYGRRISRPTFGELNPNVFFINPFQTIVGNAFLQPSFTDNLEFSALHGNLSSRVYYSREQDIFSQIPVPDANTNIITFANKNYVNTLRYGISEYFVFDKFSWWNSSNSIDVNYTVSTFDLETPHDDLKGFNSTFSTSNDFYIKKIAGLSFNLSYSYTLPGKNYIFDTGKTSNLSASVQMKLLDNRLKVSLSGNDLMKDSAEILETTVNGIYQTARYYFDSRTVYFSVAYNFGNNDISAKRHKTSNSEERNRTGN